MSAHSPTRAPLLFIVEDAPDIHDIMRRLFSTWRYITAVSVDSAERALKTLEHTNIDLVILDYQLKDGTSEGLCVRIRSDRPDVPIIAYSGNSDGIDALLKAGASAQISKPAGNAEISEVVADLLGIPLSNSAGETSRPGGIAALPPRHIDAPDAQPVERATIADLDLVLVTEHIATARERNIYQGTTDPLGFLVDQRCLVDNVPTGAGLLMFGKKPTDRIPNAVIDVVATEDKGGRKVFSKSFEGTIPQMIEQAVKEIWGWVDHYGDEHEYPYAALFEITTNALCHRDWGLSSHVQVRLWRNRINWRSPGGLPYPVTARSIGDQAVPRNPTIARLLRQAGYGVQMGRGWSLTASELRKNGNQEQELGDSEYQVRVSITGRPLSPARPSATPDSAAILASSDADLFDPEGRRSAILTLFERHPSGLTPRQIKEQFPRLSERTIERTLRDLVRSGSLIEEGSTRRRIYRLQATGAV